MVNKDFVLEWDKELGFKADPFADKVFMPINNFFVDRKDEREKLNWFFIKGYFYGTILGEAGVGKTAMLKWLEDRLLRYHRIHCVYINAAIFKEQVNIPQKIMQDMMGIYEKFISQPHKKLLSVDFIGYIKKKLGTKSLTLLIDNAHHLTDKNIELIKAMRRDGLNLQVVVTSTPKEYDKSRLEEISNDELTIVLRRFTYDEMREIVQRRVVNFGGQGIFPFEEDDLKRLYEKADKNPKEFLRLCRDEAISILIHKREQVDRERLAGHKPEHHPHHHNLDSGNEFRAREHQHYAPPQVPQYRPPQPQGRSAQRPIQQAIHKDMKRAGSAQKVQLRNIQHQDAPEQHTSSYTMRQEMTRRQHGPTQMLPNIPVREEAPPQKKKLFNIKFDMGKEHEKKPMFQPFQKKDDQQNLGDSRTHELLLNKMSSTSPRRRTGDGGAADKLLRELSDDNEE